MEVKQLYLEDLVDYDAMARAERGNQSQPEACAVSSQLVSAAAPFYARPQDSASKAALELVSRPAGEGKRKICNEFIVAVTRDGKRLRRLGGDALTWSPARRAGLYAESYRLQDYLAPLINLRGFVLSCMWQLNSLAVRRNYPLDITGVDRSLDVPTSILDWGECAKLTCLRQAFANAGQTEVASQLDEFLKI
jgi:hypothetical protein